MIYFTSDLHFNHDKDFCYIPRGFRSAEEMNVGIIKAWNAIVQPEDTVYVLGDLMLGDNQKGLNCLAQLNGTIKVILGNHDTDNRIAEYENFWKIDEVIGFAGRLRYKGYNFYLSHYPTLTSNYDDEKKLRMCMINLCGHSHTTDRFSDFDKGIIYHVDWDAHGRPISIDEIIEDIRGKFY